MLELSLFLAEIFFFFDRYTQPEKLGPNEYSCSKCGNTFQEATKQLSIKRIPPVLSIQLKVYL